MKYDPNIREEELKNKVGEDFFADYDKTQIIGDIDFSVAIPVDRKKPQLFETEYFLWAEAKAGTKHNIQNSIIQLILTIGKAKTYNKHLPPKFLGAFDAEKISFIPYNTVSDVFYQNDFNWNVTPSDHTTKEFALLSERIQQILAAGKENDFYIYDFEKDEKILRKFIHDNFKADHRKVSRVRIIPGNFTAIFNRWMEQVAPTIGVDWAKYKQDFGIIQADFYLADIFTKDNQSLNDSLKVLLNRDEYRLREHIEGRDLLETFGFKDNQRAHTAFWNRYERPPRRKYWAEMVERRDLLVPADVRERKGAFFTPSKWVDLSQQYLADVLGEEWQNEYYVWDCCAGTGNLLAGLYNKYNIYASTLDDADVRIMKQQENLLPEHVFQFDFLNDDLTSDKVPQSLREILQDEEKRKKLVIYINPPYAEAGNAKTVTRKETNKVGVSTETAVAVKYRSVLGMGVRELFAQFLIKIYKDIPNSYLAEFSKLKILQGTAFHAFRNVFRAKLEKGFVVPANTFDNVKGAFPIGFMIWDTKQNKEAFLRAILDVYNADAVKIGEKEFFSYDGKLKITDWVTDNIEKKVNDIQAIGYTGNDGPDFQHNVYLQIQNNARRFSNGFLANATKYPITAKSLIVLSVYFAVRKVIPATWLNDRDQFLYPNEGWKDDKEFQADCLAYTLFNNNIQSAHGVNHWIPFTEEEVGAHERFSSRFMAEFIAGGLPKAKAKESDLFTPETAQEGETGKIIFSEQAQRVMDAGRELWRYYHAQPKANPNASLYDIKEHFQGRNDKGKMNNAGTDETYNGLMANLREALKALAAKIKPKVYEYGFLK